MKLHKHRIVFSAALLAAASPLVAAPAHAAYTGPGMAQESISVAIADLNLSSEAGVAALYKRLQRAAETVCGPQDLRAAGSMTALRMNKTCYAETLDRAVASIAHDALGALHDA